MIPASNSTKRCLIKRATNNGDKDEFTPDHYELLHIQPQDEMLSFANTGYSQSLRAWANIEADLLEGDKIVIPDISKIYGGNIVPNGLMILDSNWNDYNFEGADINEQSTTKVLNGDHSRFVDVDQTNEGIISDSFTIVNGKTYLVDIYVYLVSGIVNILLEDSTLTLNTNIDDVGEWVQYRQEFTAGSGSATEKIIFKSNGGGAEFYVDYVAIREVENQNLEYELKGIKGFNFGGHSHKELALEHYLENVI